jgi:putative hydrolase of the HAD superfamily
VNKQQIEAVLFDLDDTLFPQRAWLEGAWARVAAAAVDDRVDANVFVAALTAIASEGSDRGQIIDRALVTIGRADVATEPLVAAFRSYVPAALPPLAGAPEALVRIRARVPIALVTDGDVDVQSRKLAALALSDAFDVLVFSDEFGREFRKPHPAPFLAALERLGVSAGGAVYVGDRPDKDVAGAGGVGMRAVRVFTGEYENVPDHVTPWAQAPDVVQAIDFICARVDAVALTETAASETPR